MFNIIYLYNKHRIKFPELIKPDFSLCYFDDCDTGYRDKNVVRTVVLDWTHLGKVHIRWGDVDKLLAINIISIEISNEDGFEADGFFFCGKLWKEMSTELEDLILTSSEKSGIIYGDPLTIKKTSIWVRYVDYDDKTRNTKHHWDSLETLDTTESYKDLK